MFTITSDVLGLGVFYYLRPGSYGWRNILGPLVRNNTIQTEILK